MMSGVQFAKTFIPLREVVFRVCLSLLQSAEDAEDATQDIYLKLWERRDELSEVDNPKAYLIRTARNKCLDRLKSPAVARKNEGDATELLLETDSSDDPHAQLVAKTQKEKPEQWVATLKEPKRSIFRLRQFEMLTNQETADRLGLQEPTVRSTLSRLRKEIRTLLLEE